MYPNAVNPDLIGEYDAHSYAGGGYVWDSVLEYRVWCHPIAGADPAVHPDGDYYYAFASYDEAKACTAMTPGADEPLALVMQHEYIDEPTPGNYVQMSGPRITEWPVEFLSRPKRTDRTIPDFLSPDAPSNRLDILRGHV